MVDGVERGRGHGGDVGACWKREAWAASRGACVGDWGVKDVKILRSELQHSVSRDRRTRPSSLPNRLHLSSACLSTRIAPAQRIRERVWADHGFRRKGAAAGSSGGLVLPYSSIVSETVDQPKNWV